jgi:DNA-binding transcriptional LysR family regulator
MIPSDLVQRWIERKGREFVLLHSFLVVGKCGSYRQASIPLDLHDTTGVKKRVRRLERLLNLALVMADTSGTMLTNDGAALFAFLEIELGASARTGA